ncbi:myotubularin-related protein [Senna tora]|uniref:Myotubularin-related protein n=1 Tax=Senna tora TaxID=362788 RepID=A0A834WQI2_9FABA|nr:myotubularin-related protein [Senna tora]
MKGREAKAAPSADLLVCFPSRAHLTLMPKPICSPARPSDSNKRHLKKSSTRGGAGQASPMLWTKTKSMGSEIAEPTSPKVTCAGQIKVRPKTTACRTWQSVMEEIEKIHNNTKQRKRSTSLGFKKEIMHFLTCLRSIRFDLRCFGSLPETDATTEDEDDEDEENDSEASRTVFSKWFMVLQENQNSGFHREEAKDKGDGGSEAQPTVPPPNALLLMRCRSAPAKSWLKQNEELENGPPQKQDKEKTQLKKGRSLKSLMEEEKTKIDNMVVMKYDSDFYEISSDIAKETWVVSDLTDPLSRSRSWKR